MVARTTTFFFICIVEIFATKQFAGKFELSLLNIKKFVDWATKSERSTTRRIVDVREAEKEGRKKRNFISILAITAPPLLREANTEQVHQIF